MELRFRPISTPEERRAMRPVIGDTVMYEGTRYVVERAGLRYLEASREDNRRIKGLLKMTDVVKVDPNMEAAATKEASPFDELFTRK